MGLQFLKANSQYITGAFQAFTSSEGTMCFWHYPYTVSGGNQSIVEAMASDDLTIQGTIVRDNDGNGPRFFIGGQGVNSDGNLTPNVWYHIAVTWGNNATYPGLRIYVNGTLRNANAGFTGKASGVAYTTIGNYPPIGSWNYLDGEVTDFRSYGVALTPTEIASIFVARGADKLVRSLNMRLLFLDGTDGSVASGAGIIKDVSVDGIDWTPTNSPIFIASPIHLIGFHQTRYENYVATCCDPSPALAAWSLVTNNLYTDQGEACTACVDDADLFVWDGTTYYVCTVDDVKFKIDNWEDSQGCIWNANPVAAGGLVEATVTSGGSLCKVKFYHSPSVTRIDAGCGAPDPCVGDGQTVYVTMSWIDADITKDFLGEIFTNGETKSICPDMYNTLSGEMWSNMNFVTTTTSWGYPMGKKDRIRLSVYAGYGFYPSVLVGRQIPGPQYGPPSIFGASTGIMRQETYYGGTWTQQVGLSLFSFEGLPDTGTYIGDGSFGVITSTNGITITWTKGPGNWKV